MTVMVPEDVNQVLRGLRYRMDEYRKLRAHNDAIASGHIKGSVPPGVAVLILERGRNREAETEAALQLRDLMRLLKEIKGPGFRDDQLLDDFDEGLGIAHVPLIAIAAAVGFTATSLFGYLQERERRIQSELGTAPSVFSGADMMLFKLAGLAALGWLGWNLWNDYKAKQKDKGESVIEGLTPRKLRTRRERAVLPHVPRDVRPVDDR